MDKDKFLVVVNKSTVPIGTARRVETVIKEELEKRVVNDVDFCVASNPEFLREGSAIFDTLYPDRIVVGAEDISAVNLLRQLYAPILEQTFTPPACVTRPDGLGLPAFVTTGLTSAELIKYASNAFLAMKISFINEIAGVSERVGADIREVAKGMGLDKRIGAGFLNAGAGWGGSCFPKDTRSILFTGRQYGCEMPLTKASIEVNNLQRRSIIEKLQETLKVIRGSTIAVWGLAFKPNTDDIREAPAIDVIQQLLDMGAKVKVYDPVAIENYRSSYPDQNITYAVSGEEAVKDSDALVLLTEWDVFQHVSWNGVADKMRRKIVIDGRNCLSGEELCNLGFIYRGMGC